MKIKGAIFDMDGTLLNSMKYWDTVGIEYLERSGIKYTNDKENNVLEVGILGFTEYCNKTYGLNKTYKQVLGEIHDIMDEKYMTSVRLKRGADKMLEKLRQNGVKICLATATEASSAKKILEKLGVLDYFEHVITTSMVGQSKRSPLIYEKALELLGTSKEEAYVFEDAVYAIKTAKGAGFNVIGIEDECSALPSNEVAKMCDYFLYEKDEYDLSFLD